MICWVIWAFATDFQGFPWPLFVMIGTGLNLVRLATSRETTISSIERDLEKKERKRLEAKQARELWRKPVEDDTSEGSWTEGHPSGHGQARRRRTRARHPGPRCRARRRGAEVRLEGGSRP